MEVTFSVLIQITTAVLVIIALGIICRKVIEQVYIYRAFNNLPIPAEQGDQHLFLGHGPKIYTSFQNGDGLDWFSSLSQKLGKIILINIGPFPFRIAMCLHADTAKTVLGPDPKGDIAYFPLMDWLGESLLTGNGKKWGRTRRMLTPGFHFDVLKPYVTVYEDCAKQLVDVWKSQDMTQSFNVFPSISLLTLDVMLRCTCSYKSDCQKSGTHSPYITAVAKLSDLAIERILFFPAYYNFIYALTPSYYKNKRACKIVHEFSMDVIKKRRAELKDSKDKESKRRKYNDFIDILLEAQDEDGHGLTDNEIRAEVDTFMFEGHDTTASGITWTLYNLAKFPDHQVKCREEVDAIFDEKGKIEWGDLKKLTYLKYCIKESLRLFPPVCLVVRQLSEDKTFDEHTLLKGSWVAANIYAVHHNPDTWDEPEKFDPMRFSQENCNGRHSHAFLAFSSGPRNCIGQEFALNEEKVILSHILRNFELSIDDTKPEVIKHFMIILRPKDGLYLKLKPRNI